MLKQVIRVIFLSTISLTAMANGSHFYLSSQAGLGSMQTPKLADKDTYELGDFTWRYSAGYLYEIDKMEYGIEIGYNGYKDNTYGKTPVVTRFRGYSNDCLLVVRYDFYKPWHIFTEFGAARFHMNTESTATTPNVQHRTKILPELAFGFGYGLTQHLALNISFDYEFGRKPKLNEHNYQVTENNIPTTSSILAGFTYIF